MQRTMDNIILKKVGLSAKKCGYQGFDGKPFFYVNLSYNLSTKDGKTLYFEWSIDVPDYELLVKTLEGLYDEYGHAHPKTLLSDIGQEKLHAMFRAICLEHKRNELSQAIADVRHALDAQNIDKPGQNVVQKLYSHPAHTFVGKLALWCLLRPFA